MTIMAVSKYATTEQIRQAYAAGLRHFGENRVQDALAKIVEFPESEFPGLHWHFIGSLQTNKAAKTVGCFSLLHSVDSLRLTRAVSEANLAAGTRQPILLQINSTTMGERHGFWPNEAAEALEKALSLPGVDTKGLMTMAPPQASLDKDEAALNRTFGALRHLRDRLAEQYGPKQPEHGHEGFLPELSMGMSRDFPYALANGATIIRVGNYLFQTG